MRRHALLAALTALLLLLSACGGDDGGDTAGRDISDVAGDDGDAGDVADESDRPSEDDLEAAEDQIAAFTNEECGEIFAGFASAASAFGGSGPDGQDLSDVSEYFSEIADRVPNEIEADFRLFAEAYAEFAEAAADAGIDFSRPETMTPEALQQMGESAELFNDPEVQEASENVSAFVEETCGTGEGS